MQSADQWPPMSDEDHIAESSETEFPQQSFKSNKRKPCMTFRRSSTQKTNIPKRLLPTKKAQTAKQYYRAGIHLHISKHNIHQQDYHWASCPAQRGRISQHFHTILRFVISLMMQSQERRPPMSEAHIAASSQTALPRQAFQVQWKRGMWPMIYRTWSTHKTIIRKPKFSSIVNREAYVQASSYHSPAT